MFPGLMARSHFPITTHNPERKVNSVIRDLLNFTAPAPVEVTRTAVEPFPVQFDPVHCWVPYRVAQLTPVDLAQPGDLVAMVAEHSAAFDSYVDPKMELEVFYVQGGDGLEVAPYFRLSGTTGDRAAHLIVQELFLGREPHNMLDSHNVVDPMSYQVTSVHFVDATLFVNREWLEGDLYGEGLERFRPILFRIDKGPDLASAAQQAAKARRYLDLFREMLPEEVRDRADWDGVCIDPKDFLEAPG